MATTGMPPDQLDIRHEDGANGGNKDVWLLPPLVPNPSGKSGYGDPFQRDPEAVLADVRNGWVTPETARTSAAGPSRQVPSPTTRRTSIGSP